MSRLEQLSHWTERLASRLPSLSQPQLRGVAWWSFAIVVCSYCGLSRVALFLAGVTGQREDALRERLRDVYRPAGKQRGLQRRELDVAACTGELLAWAAAGAQRLALALDATNLSDRFHVLTISVLCRGGAVPIAWRVLAGNQPEEWTPH